MPILRRVDGPIGKLTISNPPRNFITMEMLLDLALHLEILATDDQVKAIMLEADYQAGGGCFSAGVDLNVLAAMAQAPQEETKEFFYWLLRMLRKIEQSQKPFIPYINGPTFGLGTELSLAGAKVLLGPNAKISLPEIKHGIFPGAGGTQRMIRSVGYALGRELILTGRPMDQREACNHFFFWGVVDGRSVDEFMARAVAAPSYFLRSDHEGFRNLGSIPVPPLHEVASGHSRSAARWAERAMLEGNELPIEEGLYRELIYFFPALFSHDGRTGLGNFVNKRSEPFESVF